MLCPPVPWMVNNDDQRLSLFGLSGLPVQSLPYVETTKGQTALFTNYSRGFTRNSCPVSNPRFFEHSPCHCVKKAPRYSFRSKTRVAPYSQYRIGDFSLFLSRYRVQRVDGPSLLGGFHYTPILFHEDVALILPHKLLLAFAATVLGCIQEYTPSVGHIVAGTSCTLTTVSLTPLSRQVDDILSVLHSGRIPILPPRSGGHFRETNLFLET